MLTQAKTGISRVLAAILLASLLLYFLLPDRTIDPWGLINPKKNVLVLLLIFTVEYASFIASHFSRARRSNILLGMLSGFVSSTALVLSSSRQARARPENWRPLVIRVISGQLASLLEMIVIVAAAAPGMAGQVMLLASGALLAGGLLLTWLARGEAIAQARPAPQNAPDLKHIVSLTLFMLAILGLISLAQRLAGDMGQIASAAISGLFELHAFSLAAGTMFTQGHLNPSLFLWMLTISACSSLASKATLAATLGRGKFAKSVVALSTLLAACLLAGRLVLG